MSSGSIQSHASLRFRHAPERDQTFLSIRRAGGLFHVSKPYWDQAMLITQLVNPTAGIFEGDRMKLDVHLEQGARVSLVSPSATRIHTMCDKKAKIIQNVHLAEQSFLEFRSDYMIPQKGSSLEQQTHIHCHDAARLFFVERLMPGRVGHGESFDFETFQATLFLHENEKCIVQEKLHLNREHRGFPLLVKDWKSVYMANVWIMGLDAELAVNQMHDASASGLTHSDSGMVMGISPLESNVVVCRLLSNKSSVLKEKIVQLRSFYAQYFSELGQSTRTLLSNHT